MHRKVKCCVSVRERSIDKRLIRAGANRQNQMRGIKGLFQNRKMQKGVTFLSVFMRKIKVPALENRKYARQVRSVYLRRDRSEQEIDRETEKQRLSQGRCRSHKPHSRDQGAKVMKNRSEVECKIELFMGHVYTLSE
jgi:hypothetical protein